MTHQSPRPSAPDPHDLLPAPAHDKVDAFVQRWVAGTNGNMYVPVINKLHRYPIPRWPGKGSIKVNRTGQMLLDIGCGWGRWMVSAGKQGYTPIGIDIKPDALKAARRVLAHHQLKGFVVCTDLGTLPFDSDLFDSVFSYSVLQHTHRSTARACVAEIQRVLMPQGDCLIELPVSHGVTNWRHSLRWSRRNERDLEDDLDSWVVRYYSWNELQRLFASFERINISVDCAFGIGLRPEDMDIVPWRYRPLLVASEAFRHCCSIFPPLRKLSDSVFIAGRKPGVRNETAQRLRSLAVSGSNLDLVPYLRCPVSGGPLHLNAAKTLLHSPAAGLSYPVLDDIPILLRSAASLP